MSVKYFNFFTEDRFQDRQGPDRSVIQGIWEDHILEVPHHPHTSGNNSLSK